MRVVCAGGGPAGLFFSILLRLARPDAEVAVFERNRAEHTFGWGVVFSDLTLDNIGAADPATGEAIERNFVHWDAIDVNYRGRTLRAAGQGFSGIARKRLLAILQERARQTGVELHFASEIGDETQLGEADALVFADGANSLLRRAHAGAFGTSVDLRHCRYIWLGTHHRFDAFTFAFEETPAGWFAMHAYQFDRETGTVIVECREETWRAAGLDTASTEDAIALCERLFSKHLGGERLMSNASHLANAWLRFPHITNER
ncbi:MAG: bifunctional salicylyl-CoA 5-hydroxylase/oxidoreductase, partial [Candidatus Eremiobacteraeota bacterium]|nr:bifunctional salicylyl-CoA 5-hydroxylase/oxidoreductase [Candidatus Eremiobacteraeota bacterium]